MHHKKSGRKFGRNTPHRRAMLRNLAGNLVLHERVETTDAKAKEIRRTVERLITRAAPLTLRYLLHAHRGGPDAVRAKQTLAEFAARPPLVLKKATAKHETYTVTRG